MKQRLAIIAASAALVALALPGTATAADVQVVAGRAIGTHGTLMVATQNNMTRVHVRQGRGRQRRQRLHRRVPDGVAHL